VISADLLLLVKSALFLERYFKGALGRNDWRNEHQNRKWEEEKHLPLSGFLFVLHK
jgi:hypothetical protein